MHSESLRAGLHFPTVRILQAQSVVSLHVALDSRKEQVVAMGVTATGALEGGVFVTTGGSVMGLKKSVGSTVGVSDVEVVGDTVGTLVGDFVDAYVGVVVGESESTSEGTFEGTSDVGKNKLFVGANESNSL